MEDNYREPKVYEINSLELTPAHKEFYRVILEEHDKVIVTDENDEGGIALYKGYFEQNLHETTLQERCEIYEYRFSRLICWRKRGIEDKIKEAERNLKEFKEMYLCIQGNKFF